MDRVHKGKVEILGDVNRHERKMQLFYTVHQLKIKSLREEKRQEQ